MAKFKLDAGGFDEIIKRLNALNGDVKGTTEAALRATNDIVVAKAKEGMRPQYLPAKGKYADGSTLDALREEAVIDWKGDVAAAHVGFDIKKGGLASIFLMYGTPRMKPDRKLYDAFESPKTKQEIAEAQREVFYKEITKLMTGG